MRSAGKYETIEVVKAYRDIMFCDNEARCLSHWIPEQPDIDIKTEPLKKIKFYCPLKIAQIPEEEAASCTSASTERRTGR